MIFETGIYWRDAYCGTIGWLFCLCILKLCLILQVECNKNQLRWNGTISCALVSIDVTFCYQRQNLSVKVLIVVNNCSSIALWNKSNGSYDIKEFGTLPLIFSTSKYFRWKFQPWPSFFPHANIPDTWKRGQLSLEQMKKMEKVKVKSHLRYLAACSIQKKRWDIWRIFFSDFRSVFSP